MDCIIYIRWSSAIQARGSSKARQKDICGRHAAGKGWNVIDTLVDDGVSAFSGMNIAGGELGRFIVDAEEGRWPGGVVLLAERLDRISRQGFEEQYAWIKRANAAGVTVATQDGDESFAPGSRFGVADIMKIALKSELARDESVNKANKLAAVWRIKRERIADGETFVMTRRAPAWLKVEGKPPAFVLIPERAAIVRRIFDETVAGLGKAIIAKRLNQEGVKTFGRASGWHSSYIQKILSSPTVLGEMQPGSKSRGTARVLVGDPIQGYYPAVIDADLYARARRSMASRSRRVAGKGRRLVNIFSGIAKCGECGERMTFRGKGEKVRADGERVNEDFLVCDSYQRGRGCTNKHHFNYPAWETAVLEAVLSRAMGDERFASRREVRDLEVELAELVRVRDVAIRKRDVLRELYAEEPLEDVKVSYLEHGAAAKQHDVSIAQIRSRIVAARGAVSAEEHQKRIADLFEEMESSDEEKRFEARSRVMDAVHELVEAMKFKPTPPVVEVTTRGGIGCAIEWQSGQGPRAEFWFRYDEGFF